MAAELATYKKRCEMLGALACLLAVIVPILGSVLFPGFYRNRLNTNTNLFKAYNHCQDNSDSMNLPSKNMS